MLRIRSTLLLGATSAMLFALPMSMRAQAVPAQLTCKDGSMSASGKGACSGHGGVDKKATKAATKASTKAATADKAVKLDAKTKAAAATAPTAMPAPAPAAKPMPAAAKTAPAPVPAPSAAATKPAAAPTAAAPKGVAPPVAAAPSKAAPQAAASATASKDGPPTAKCKDGSMSYSKGHSGACSRHGGVAEWLDGTAKKP